MNIPVRPAASSLPLFLAAASVASFPGPASAARVYVGGVATSVGIIDQHPQDRGEALYDTQPNATGLYNRTLDADTVNPARRYDALPEYYDATSAQTLNLSLINGAWYCGPTSALSLVKYWDADPRFPKLFDPAAGDTDRSVILDLGARMDADDLAALGGNDANERHLGVRLMDLAPGLKSYVDGRYPTFFNTRELYIGQPGVTYDQVVAGYTTAIRRNIPVLLLQRNHIVAGIGFDDAFTSRQPGYFRVNNPWDAAADIPIDQVGQGRLLPNFAAGVFGISYAEELYGPGADIYDESPYANPEDALPYGIIWLELMDDPLVIPLPPAMGLLGSALAALGGAVGVGRRRGR